MKTLLILLLMLALCAAAFFTRPDKEHFVRHLVQVRTAGVTAPEARAAAEAEARAYTERCAFDDRYLWVDVKRDGQVVYSGVFAHWFKRGQ